MRQRRAASFYGHESEDEALEWEWVDEQLRESGLYWTNTRVPAHPHPRPVWGVWNDERLYLSIGTPLAREVLSVDPLVTVHLESGTDVVILEGLGVGESAHESVIDAYNAKYDWTYDIEEYGALTEVVPVKILAWRAAGWAGRESFTHSGRWDFL
jgi:hypothetical protein